MAHELDFSQLDQPFILMFVFHPREDWSPPPPGAVDHAVPVDAGVSVGCRFYPVEANAPSILFFHGNGEVVYDYDGLAPLYSRIGVNLFVADYRGYGQSGGTPSFANTVADAPIVFDYFRDMLRSGGFGGPLFVMGRSLGSLSAIELAMSRAGEFTGLIIESGFASAGRLLTLLNPFMPFSGPGGFEEANLERIRAIAMPLLIIHGEWDEIIPHEQAEILHETAGSTDKTLLTIPGAGHNDIMLVGMDAYFSAVREFVFGHP